MFQKHKLIAGDTPKQPRADLFREYTTSTEVYFKDVRDEIKLNTFPKLDINTKYSEPKDWLS